MNCTSLYGQQRLPSDLLAVLASVLDDSFQQINCRLSDKLKLVRFAEADTTAVAGRDDYFSDLVNVDELLSPVWLGSECKE
jgi:hypothetical protein